MGNRENVTVDTGLILFVQFKNSIVQRRAPPSIYKTIEAHGMRHLILLFVI